MILNKSTLFAYAIPFTDSVVDMKGRLWKRAQIHPKNQNTLQRHGVMQFYRERYVVLKGNMLILFRTEPTRISDERSMVGCILLESYRVEELPLTEINPEAVPQFSDGQIPVYGFRLLFNDRNRKQEMESFDFICESWESYKKWVRVLKHSSLHQLHMSLHKRLQSMQALCQSLMAHCQQLKQSTCSSDISTSKKNEGVEITQTQWERKREKELEEIEVKLLNLFTAADLPPGIRTTSSGFRLSLDASLSAFSHLRSAENDFLKPVYRFPLFASSTCATGPSTPRLSSFQEVKTTPKLIRRSPTIGCIEDLKCSIQTDPSLSIEPVNSFTSRSPSASLMATSRSSAPPSGSFSSTGLSTISTDPLNRPRELFRPSAPAISVKTMDFSGTQSRPSRAEMHSPDAVNPLNNKSDTFEFEIHGACQLKQALVEAIKHSALLLANRASRIATNFAGRAVGGVAENAEVLLVLFQRRMDSSFKASQDLNSAELESGWRWVEVARTEVAEVKDLFLAEWIVPLPFRPSNSVASHETFRFEIHSLGKMDPDTMIVKTRCVAFVECTDRQLLSGVRPQTAVVADRRPASPIFADKTVVCSLFAPHFDPGSTKDSPFSAFEAGQIVGELILNLSEMFARPLTWTHLMPKVETVRFEKHYRVPTDDHHNFRLQESVTESPFSYLVPLALLQALMEEEKTIVDELEAMAMVLVPSTRSSTSRPGLSGSRLRCSCGGKCKLTDDLDIIRQRQVFVHRDLLRYYSNTRDCLLQRLKHRRSNKEAGIWLRRSTEKKDADLQWVTLNCGLQELVVQDTSASEVSVFQITTLGAPAGHAYGFKSQQQQSNTMTYLFGEAFYRSATKPNDSSLDPTMSPMAGQPYQDVLKHFAKSSLERLRETLSGHKSQFAELERLFRTSVTAWIDLPRHVPEKRQSDLKYNANENLRQLVWLITDSINFAQTACLAQVATNVGRGISGNSLSIAPRDALRYFRQKDQGCGGIVQLDLETEVLQLREILNQRDLPNLKENYRKLSDELWQANAREHEAMHRALTVLSMDWKSYKSDNRRKSQIATQDEMKEDQGVTTKDISDIIQSFSTSLNQLSTDFSLLLVKSVALIEQQCLIVDYFAVGNEARALGLSPNIMDESVAGQVLQHRQRRDAVMSQALGAIVTSFNAMISRWFRLRRQAFGSSASTFTKRRASDPVSASYMPDEVFLAKTAQRAEDDLFWETLTRVGFMAQLESLLSVQGDEKGMLEDVHHAFVDICAHVSLAIHCLPNGEDATEELPLSLVRIYGPRHQLIVSVGLDRSIYETAPKTLRNGDVGISIFAVLFSQGINEQQVFANLSGDSKKQDFINASGYRRLEEFVNRWKAFIKQKSLHSEQPIVDGMDLKVQFCYPIDLVTAADNFMFDIKSILGLGIASEKISLLDEDDGKPQHYSSQVSAHNYHSGSPGPAPLSHATLAIAKSMRARFKNQTSLLLLVSHLTRLLANCNPQAPSTGCTMDYTFSNHLQSHHMDFVNHQSRPSSLFSTPIVIQLYPTTPVAGRLTCCKSAKDRTSMAVTLEQTLCIRYRGVYPPSKDISTGVDFIAKSPMDALHEAIYADRHRPNLERTLTQASNMKATCLSAAPLCHHLHACIHPDYFIKLLMAMRSESGVRLQNVERNLCCGPWQPSARSSDNANDDRRRPGASGKFAFNQIQWTVLPMLYRPPLRCIQGKVMN